MAPVDDLNNGTIARTPLPQGGIRNLAHGAYNVTGGVINIGTLPNGTITKIIGINPNDPNAQLAFGFRAGPLGINQPFSSNLAKVLYEMKQAGATSISKSNINNNDIMRYIEMFRAHEYNKFPSEYEEYGITPRLINDLHDS